MRCLAGPVGRLTAAYDGTRPHTRVMGIEHIYLAPPTGSRSSVATSAPVIGGPISPPNWVHDVLTCAATISC